MFAIIKDIGAILLGFAGLIIGYLFNSRTLNQRRHEDERKELYKKLDAFYGPLQQLLGKNRELYTLFTISKEEGFRTLVALLEGEQFEGNDKILLEEILKTTERIEELVCSQSGLIDDPELKQLLIKAITHFGIVRLAYQGVLRGEKERFKEYVFPKELDVKIENRVKQLQARLNELNAI